MRQYGEDSLTEQALGLIRPLWDHATRVTPMIARAIESSFALAFEEVHAKFDKDFNLMKDLPIEDGTVLCWTNRRIVSNLNFL